MPTPDDIRHTIDGIPGGQSLMDGLVHEVAGRMASRANNEGLKAQLDFLNTNGMDDESILTWLKEAADE